MVGDHHRFAPQPPAHPNAGRVQLRQVQADHVVLGNQLGGHPANRRHDDAFAHPQRNGHADHIYPVQHFAARQLGIVLRRQHGDGMAPFRQAARQPLDVDRQARHVRAIISNRNQNFHCLGEAGSAARLPEKSA